MKIAGVYSFNGGKEAIEAKFGVELREVKQIIAAVDSIQYKTKTSLEKTMPGKTLYSPRALNKAFRAEFEARNWQRYKVRCDYPLSITYLATFPSPCLKALSARWTS